MSQLANFYLEQGRLDEASETILVCVHDLSWQRLCCTIAQCGGSLSAIPLQAEANFKETIRVMMAAGVEQAS